PKVKYQVLKGGQNITCQAYNAISQITNHVYNVAVPSLETIISREVLWKSTVTLKIAATTRSAGYYVVNYGVTDALAPFPLHSLVNVMSATINNNTVSFNVQETLPLLLRMADPEELAKYDCMTPTTLEFLADYDNGVTTMDWQIDTPVLAVNQLQANNTKIYEVADDDDEGNANANPARVAGRRAVAYQSYANSVLSYDMNRPAATA
ncbi:MAG: phage major capsid domain-containing protein, partial [Candidatus Fonsibacter sp.]